jgi:predicted AAA+ superfamily ATPase
MIASPAVRLPSRGHAARRARAWLVEIRHRSLSKVGTEGCRKRIFSSAALVSEESLREAAGINAKTAREYQALFQRMFVLDLVPAWFSNRVKRLVKTPKRYLVDPALVAAVLGLGRDAILYGPRHARPTHGHLRHRSAARNWMSVS